MTDLTTKRPVWPEMARAVGGTEANQGEHGRVVRFVPCAILMKTDTGRVFGECEQAPWPWGSAPFCGEAAWGGLAGGLVVVRDRRTGFDVRFDHDRGLVVVGLQSTGFEGGLYGEGVPSGHGGFS